MSSGRSNSIRALLLCATGLVCLCGCHEKTEPTPENEQTQFQVKKAEAEKGDVVAQFHLAYYYQIGEGVEKDYVEAYAWYNVAGKTLDMSAGSRDDLEKKMSPQQVADAQKRSKELRAQVEAKLKGGGR